MGTLLTERKDFLEYMQEQLNGVAWYQFESIPSGDKLIAGIEFKLRVGLHLKRPFQAIIALKQFIRMRAAPKFEGTGLKKLTAEFPDTCRYGPKNNQWAPHGAGQVLEEPESFDSIILDQAHIYNGLLARRRT